MKRLLRWYRILRMRSLIDRLRRIDEGIETCDWVIRTLSPVHMYPDAEINRIMQRRMDSRAWFLTVRVKTLVKIQALRKKLEESHDTK